MQAPTATREHRSPSQSKPLAQGWKKWPPTGVMQAQWCVGVVDGARGQQWQVTSGSARVLATRAMSCVHEPKVGDTVACLFTAPDEAWITSVLGAVDEGERDVNFGCDVRLHGNAMKLDCNSYEVKSKQLSLSADQMRISFEDAQAVGCRLSWFGTSVKLVGSVFSSVFDRVNQFSKRYARRTEGMDRVSATYIESEADQLARHSAENVLINGANLVKARGGQIHFG